MKALSGSMTGVACGAILLLVCASIAFLRPIDKPLTKPLPGAPKQEPGGAYERADPRWAEMRRREKVDPAWQGRTPISFYGVVVDERGQPVSGATVKFQWTDLSLKGASSRTTESDERGFFSLSGVRGKNLGVWVEKAGYDTSRVQNRFSYEYSGFWEKDYHEPDANNPVVFRLRKKTIAAPLVVREDRIGVAVGVKTPLKLDEHTLLTVELLDNGQLEAGRWSARVEVSGGGLQLTAEEFPVRAPSDGYQSEITLDVETPKPPPWEDLYNGGVLYLKTPRGYGRVEIRMISGKSRMRVNSFLNPSGSPILEGSSEDPPL